MENEGTGEGDDDGFYLHAIQDIYHEFEQFIGAKTALIKARKAPLDIDKDGAIVRYYGRGEVALDTLVDQYASYLGEEAAYSKARRVLEDTVHENDYDRLPDHLKPREQANEKPLQRLEKWLSGLFPHPEQGAE